MKKMFILVYKVIFFSAVLNLSEAARILAVFPVPSISHQVVFRPLIHELAKRGHEVTVITPDPAFPKGGTPENLTEIDVHDVSYNLWKKDFVESHKGRKEDVVAEFEMTFKLFRKVFDAQLKDKEVQKLINDKNQHFDLIFGEGCARISIVFSHIYKAPAILVSSLGAVFDNYEKIGAPNHPFLYPITVTRSANIFTIWDKLTELYNYYIIDSIQRDSYKYENQMLRSHFGPDLPPLEELYNNVAMLFLNVHPIFEGNRPVPPSVIYMGGLHQKPHQGLPNDLKSYLDSSKNGVIYVSFGTNVDPSLLPPEKIQTMVRVFSQLPYDVLWKWNKDELPGRTDNIKISKWLPQSDLLRHPKIKLFIMQGGLQSTDEAITAGVPLIGVPMLGDQWFNVGRYVHHKIGLNLDLGTLTEESLKTAINTIINDKSYRQNIVRLGRLMRDEPMRPLDRAVWWTEYVLRHGGAKHLRAPAANISWAQYLELELVFSLLIALLIGMTVCIVIVRFLYNNILRNYVATIKMKSS